MDSTITLTQFLENEEIARFIQQNIDCYMPRSSFEHLRLPAEISADEAWDLLALFRCITAQPNYFGAHSKTAPSSVSLEGSRWYWHLTCETNEKLYCIESVSNEHATLWKSLRKPHQRSLVRAAITCDIQAALEREGLIADESNSSFAKQTPPELTSKTVDALKSELIGILTNNAQPYQREQLERIVERGRALAGEVPEPIRAPRKDASPDFPLSYHSEQDALEEIDGNFKRPTRMGFHPIASMLMNSDIIWHSRSFGPGSALTEMLLRYHFLSLHHLPSLALVPISHMRLQWEKRTEPTPDTPWPFGQAHLITRFGIDGTPYLNTMVGLWEKGLRALEHEAGNLDDRHHASINRISEDWRLNHRQRDFLLDSLGKPEGTTVASYGAQFDIAPATARSDLTKLVRLGYLSTSFEGKRQVFWLSQS